VSIDVDADEPIPEYDPEDLFPEWNLLNLAQYARIVGTSVRLRYRDNLELEKCTAEFEIVDQERTTGGPFRFKSLVLDRLDADEETLYRCTLSAYSHLKKLPEDEQFPDAVGHAKDMRVLEDGGDGS
jgi:hypothetical protein